MTRVQVARWVLPVVGLNIIRAAAFFVFSVLDR